MTDQEVNIHRRTALRRVGCAALVGTAGCTDRLVDHSDDRPGSERTAGHMDGDWPMEHNDPTNSRAVSVAGPTGDVDVRWTREVDATLTGDPMVANSLVYHSTPESETITAFEAATGDRIATALTGATNGSPLYIAHNVGLVFEANGTGGIVRAIDIETGEEQWQESFSTHIAPMANYANGRFYVGTLFGGELYALDEQNGTVLWTYETADTTPGAPAADGNLVVVTTGELLVGLSTATGERLWSVRLDGEPAADPVLVSGTVLVGDDAGTVHAFDRSGTPKWHRTVSNRAVYSLAVEASTVYAGTTAGVWGLDLDSGEHLVTAHENNAAEGITAAGDRLYIAGGSRVTALSYSSFEPDWTLELDALLRDGPTVLDSGVYVTTRPTGNESVANDVPIPATLHALVEA
ncbi:PQQ-binding-like beta-propeller repeat protein [Natranaeroarchaeum aerophilus]|uniref:PQQ-binding-like beta-propeller repeat protein n=1 Tax=Natranaeroarchaeum aerophilus TaxID=2917711 RepID=A0AAE3K609_9EURY|nr:PQQ-binding-like beta-propeller repeat protein [Natranaeroarchaeum aerophilus]MCL9812294.1 PQQ-binding-like beta-propeller repeat protein [Natranaeroarchaeum aerophilus]